jgi:hypothetical protein
VSLVYWGFYISDRTRHGGRMCWTRQPLSIVSDDHMEPSMRFQALVYHGKLDKNELNIWSCQFVILNILHRWLLLFQGLWSPQEDTYDFLVWPISYSGNISCLWEADITLSLIMTVFVPVCLSEVMLFTWFGHSSVASFLACLTFMLSSII